MSKFYSIKLILILKWKEKIKFYMIKSKNINQWILLIDTSWFCIQFTHCFTASPNTFSHTKSVECESVNQSNNRKTNIFINCPNTVFVVSNIIYSRFSTNENCLWSFKIVFKCALFCCFSTIFKREFSFPVNYRCWIIILTDP